MFIFANDFNGACRANPAINTEFCSAFFAEDDYSIKFILRCGAGLKWIFSNKIDKDQAIHTIQHMIERSYAKTN